ncbi:DUF1491 family protein [Croceicoccus mobilis]|uniref:DUF1491 domain-containing protein n=1 Tax=Croceicoccus mobilis TaxID=1703339 RepID=A0A916YTT1_9SPHN|nr:DUF1491 family protein [Croceicoccus mobilis]GGD60177.1 hypothetical protein GCM10010990_07030 [Croceicoccus mobilis]
MDSRLPAHLETSGIMRAVQLAGGFATVLQRGERDAGTILIATRDLNAISCLYERMPDLDGNRVWTKSREEPPEKEREFSEYIARRGEQDPDCWIIEIEIAQPERFIC